MNPLYEIKISCRDRPGIIAAVTRFIHHELGGNILDLNHHSEEEGHIFFLLSRFTLPPESEPLLHLLNEQPAFQELKRTYDWSFSVYDPALKPKIALLVSTTDHCLYELILKVQEGYLDTEIACVLSNHTTLERVARQFDLPFHYFPTGDDRAGQEALLDEALRRYNVDTVVLARYMQILSNEFIRRWEGRIVNVHHGFLPAFKGARPYHQAWKRGVKLIGATAHYATEDLDEGPILYQDVAPVRNNLSVKAFIQSGRDIERKVIVEGLKLHLERRVFLYEGRTIIL
jgi:formyltetrahydrofolate deformylase